MKKLLFSCLPIVLSACSSAPVPTSDATPISDSKIFFEGKKYLSPSPNTGQVIVKRDSGLLGSWCATTIYVDGKPAAEIGVSEKVILNLSEGEHFIGAEPSGICAGGLSEVAANVRSGVTMVFRYGISGNGIHGIYPTSP